MFSEAIEELKRVFFVVDVIHILANSFIVFLGFLLFFLLFRFSWMLAFIPFVVALAYFSYIDLTKNKMLIVEENVPELKERLRAAHDSAGAKGWIAESLKEDVLRDMQKVRASYFLDFRRLSVKLFSIFALSFLVVFISFANINFDFGGFVANIVPVPNQVKWAESIGGEGLVYYSGNLSDVLGKPSLAKLGSKELELKLGQVETEVDIRDIRAVEEKDFTRAEFPKEMYTSYEEAYVERIPKENQEIVKNYFADLTS